MRVLDNSIFFLYGNKLKLQPDIDLDDQSSYMVRVRSADFDGESVERDLEFIVNHPPESIEVSVASLSENLDIGTRVLFLLWIDSGDLFDYSLIKDLVRIMIFLDFWQC